MNNPTKNSIAIAVILNLTMAANSQVTPVLSSATSESSISLSVVDQSDESTVSDEQLDTLTPLGISTANVGISSSQGTFSATTSTSASFEDAASGQFVSSMQYLGNEGPGKIQAQSFGHTLNGKFIYEFMIPADGTLNVTGLLTNNHVSFIGFTALVSLQAEFTLGGGFAGFIFSQFAIDNDNSGTESFNFEIPLDRPTGSYRLIIELRHSGVGLLDQVLQNGALDASFNITTTNPCPADITEDGVLDFFDVSAFLTAFGNQDPVADFNGDLTFDFFDVSAFLTEFSMGCP